MDRTQLLKRISSKPGVLGGRPCIAGTRIPVEIVLENLADGVSRDELLAAYPSLGLEDIAAALAFGAELARIIWVGIDPPVGEMNVQANVVFNVASLIAATRRWAS